MPKSISSKLIRGSKLLSAEKQASTKKLVYAAILKDQDKKITQEVQAALRSARAGELLFKKG